jgi:hypothetical protein
MYMPTYVIQVESGKEDYIRMLLERAFRKYHPEVTVYFHVPKKPFYWHCSSSRAEEAGTPLVLEYKVMFPGYLFVECGQIREFDRAFADWIYESWYRLLGKDVNGFRPLGEDETGWIRLLSAPPSRAEIREGKLVFLSGSLLGMEEYVCKVKAARKHVCMRIPFQGGTRDIWVAVEITGSQEESEEK